METPEFLDMLHQGWSKTTGAADTYWMPEEIGGSAAGLYKIYAVDENQERVLVAMGLNEADSAFITALHGCFADLFRTVLEAVDEAERADIEKDDAVNQMAQLVIENDELRGVKEN